MKWVTAQVQPHEVDKLLNDYRTNKARLAELELRNHERREQLCKAYNRAMADDAIQAQQYSGMPHGNAVGSPVEALALRYMDGYLPPIIRAEQADIEREKQEIQRLRLMIRRVDVWLWCLDTRARYVISAQMIDGQTWQRIENGSESVFGFHMTAGGLRKIKQRAMQTIYAVAA